MSFELILAEEAQISSRDGIHQRLQCFDELRMFLFETVPTSALATNVHEFICSRARSYFVSSKRNRANGESAA